MTRSRHTTLLMLSMTTSVLVFPAIAWSDVTWNGPKTTNSSGWAYERLTTEVFYPNSSPVEVSGWVDVSGLSTGGVLMLGLIDARHWDNGGYTWMSGAYGYFGNLASGYRVGPTDGNLGGEIVQDFDTIPKANGSRINFTLLIDDGTMTMNVRDQLGNSYTSTDTYGGVKTLNNTNAYSWNEFQHGAYLGFDIWDGANNTVDFNIRAVPAPGAVLLGMIGFGLVGWVKRRFA